MLEQKIEELTQAIKELTEATRQKNQGVMSSPEAVKPLKAEKPSKEKPVSESVKPSLSKDTLFSKLKEHAETFNLKATKALMIAHGADSVNTTTASIPVAAYETLYNAAVQDISKVNTNKQEVFE